MKKIDVINKLYRDFNQFRGIRKVENTINEVDNAVTTANDIVTHLGVDADSEQLDWILKYLSDTYREVEERCDFY